MENKKQTTENEVKVCKITCKDIIYSVSEWNDDRVGLKIILLSIANKSLNIMTMNNFSGMHFSNAKKEKNNFSNFVCVVQTISEIFEFFFFFLNIESEWLVNSDQFEHINGINCKGNMTRCG